MACELQTRQVLPQETSEMIEAAHQEGRAARGPYQQRRSKTRWDDYCTNFRTEKQTNMMRDRKRETRRLHEPDEGVWREPRR